MCAVLRDVRLREPIRRTCLLVDCFDALTWPSMVTSWKGVAALLAWHASLCVHDQCADFF